MAEIKHTEMRFLDRVFDMESGYVLDFSNRTISDFFEDELGVDIYDSRYEVRGSSKANRVRCYLQTVDNSSAAQALKALWSYRSDFYEMQGLEDPIPKCEGKILNLIAKLGGSANDASGQQPAQAYSQPKYGNLKSSLLALSLIEPITRGFKFEEFLKQMFEEFGLLASGRIRRKGEEIDGSFVLDGNNYLLEAKYRNNQSSASDLHIFQGKIAERPTWTRGLFVSFSGFTPECFSAFGNGKSIICMDSTDIFEALDNEWPVDELIRRKVRFASEHAEAFVPARHLFG